MGDVHNRISFNSCLIISKALWITPHLTLNFSKEHRTSIKREKKKKIFCVQNVISCDILYAMYACNGCVSDWTESGHLYILIKNNIDMFHKKNVLKIFVTHIIIFEWTVAAFSSSQFSFTHINLCFCDISEKQLQVCVYTS